jgi:predicted TIM-barrel fold metal-dependent hydrolase
MEALLIIEWNAHMFSSNTDRYPFHPRAAYVPKADRLSADPLADYMRRMKSEGIDRAVIVHPEPYGDDHRLVIDCVRREPALLKTTALFYPDGSQAPGKLKRLIGENPGVFIAHRFHAHEGKRTYLGSFQDEEVRTLWRTGGELGLVIELHIGSDYAAQVDRLIAENPEYPVLIDHLAEARYGSAPQFGDVVRLARHPNVYMKLSGLDHFATDGPLFESALPFTRWIADAYGPDRMVWGSGTPRIVDAHLAHWSDADREKVRGGNLQKLLGWS